MVESTALEMQQIRKGFEGSNPSVSARHVSSFWVSGGIGRHLGFRCRCRKAWGFESLLTYHIGFCRPVAQLDQSSALRTHWSGVRVPPGLPEFM